MRTLVIALAACLYLTGCGGSSGSATTSGTTAATLTSIAVSAANPAIPKAFSEQLAATGTYSDGTSADITSTVAWSSADTTIAAVTAAGVVSGITAGTAAIHATLDGISGSASVVITAASLSSIAVTPVTVTLPDGLTQQLTALGNYSDGTSLNITSSVTWASSDTSVATVSATGVARAAAAGTATIAATFGSISGSTAFTATSATLESIAVTPTNPNFPNGLTQKLAAIATYSDGSSRDISLSAVWSSSDASVASVDSTGVVRGLAVGTSTITAKSGTVSATTALTVTAATLSSLTLSPANPGVPLGLTQQLTATGTYSDGGSFDLTSAVTWSSSATAVATVSPWGQSKAVAVGSTIITAKFGTTSSAVTLQVTPAALESIALTPANPAVAKGLSQQVTAIGAFSDGSSRDVSSSVTWSSSNPAVATIGATGLAQGISVGTSTIGVASGALSASTTLTVTAASLSSIAITPANPSIYRGLTQQFTAMGTYSDGTVVDISSAVGWSSSVTVVATVTASGLASPGGFGTTAISATLGAVSASTNLTVTPPPLVTTQAVLTLPANASAMQSIVISITGINGTLLSVQNITVGNPPCSTGNTCTFTFSAPVGSDTFTFTTYDQSNTGSGPYVGNILAQSTLTYAVTLGGANQINAALGAVPVSIAITPTSTSYYLLGSATAGFVLYGTAVESVNVVAYDADHNALIGSGAPILNVMGPNGVVVTPSGSPNVYGLKASAFNISGTLVVTATPVTGTGGSGISESVSLATRHRVVYVADSATGSVDFYYDGQTTAPQTQIISVPAVAGLGVTNDGSIIVPLQANNSVVVYEPFSTTPAYTITAGLKAPVNACTDQENNIYVVNGNGSGDIARFPDGQVLMTADYTVGENFPVACAIDTDDSLWVVNYADSTIVHYPHNSTTPDQYWTLAGGTGEVPSGLAIDHSGNLYVSSVDVSGVSRVRFYPKGSQTSSFAIITPQAARVGSSLAVDASGALWVGSYGGSLVYYPAPITGSSVPIDPGYSYGGASQIVGVAVSP